ncbi:Leucoanthocyanidin dioxygenase [Platanthera guangdongensis]|uniref:Leucoanthocyanidin dioxygenase n=1 Tax=Platanthera guangdongensis TaxID=2320717 RepID=A0ABR2LJ03_9ASPA
MVTSVLPSSLISSSSVKELVINSSHNSTEATSMPSVYVARNPAMAAAEIIGHEEIPTIDLSLLIRRSEKTSADERAKVIQQLGEACQDWGCFMAVNHGVPEDLQRKMIEAYLDFFDMKDEEKQRYNSKSFINSVVYNASFDQTTNEVLYWRDGLITTVHPTFNSPDQPQNFRLISEEFSRRTREIAKQLVVAICEGLGLEENRTEECLGLASCYQALSGNLYPPCPQPELALGLPPHSDAGLLSVLMQNNSFPGLQVMHNGNWVQVQLIPNSLFIVVSDLLEIFSNGKYKSLLHRVTVDKKMTRLSVVTAIGSSWEGVVVAPAVELVETEPAAFRGITYKDYIRHYQSGKLNKRPLAAIRL